MTGQVRIVVDRQTIRRQLDDLVQCVIETNDVLLWQSVDQVDGNRLEAELARRLDHDPGLVKRLHAIYGNLHRGLEVLNADTHAIEAELGKKSYVLAIDLARIEYSPLGSKRKCLLINSISRRISSSARKVGVPPPQWS